MATGFWPISISIWVCLIFSVRSQLQCVLKSGFHWEFTSMNPWIPRSEPAILTGDQFTCYQYPRYTWDIPPTKKGVQTWGLTVHRDENRESRDDPGSNKTCVALSLNSFNWLKKENEWYIYIYGLVVWNLVFLCFHSVGNNHPNWRTHILQRGWNHQPDM